MAVEIRPGDRMPTVAPRSVFARKNYFYPDLPKGYQISQYELPIVQRRPSGHRAGGRQRQDASASPARIWKRTPASPCTRTFTDMTGIDLNRAGTPLLEIVSEPDMRSAKEAVAYMKKLHALVRYLEICDGNMQEGSFRCDANVSVRRKGRARIRHPCRDQEPQLLPLRGARHQLRGRAPDRHAGRRRQGRPGDAAVRRRQGRDPLHAHQGRGQRLPLFPRSRSAAPGDRGGIHRRPCAPALPELPDAKHDTLHAASSACRPTTPACSPPAASWRDYYEAGGRTAQAASPSLPPTG